MIKASSKQSGSTHVIIIVILIIALLGTLGFVFWKNYINKGTPKSVVYQTPKSWVVYKEDDVPFVLEYPSSWVIEKGSIKTNKTNETSHATLKAQDKTKRELLSIEYSREPEFSAGGTGCQINSKSPNCLFLSNAISEGFLNKRDGVWIGQGKGSSELFVLRSYTDEQTTQTIIESLRKK